MNLAAKISNALQIVIMIVVVIFVVAAVASILGIPMGYSLIGSAVITVLLFLFLWIIDRSKQADS